MSLKADRPPTRQPSPRDTRWRAILIFAGAILLRLAIAHAYPPADAPEIAFYRGDAPAYHQYSLALARGETYDQGLPFHPPLLAFLATPVYWLYSGTVLLFPVLTVVLAAVGATVAVFTYHLGSRLAGPSAGLIAGLAAALHFGLAAASTTLNVESLSAALELGAVLTLLPVASERPRRASNRPPGGSNGTRHPYLRTTLAGILAGLAALARAENQFLILALAAWASWKPRRGFDAKAGLAILAGALVVMLPWTVRNAITIDHFNRTRAPFLAEPLRRFAPVTAYGGLNFALANHPEADGGFSPDPLAGGGTINLGRPEHLEFMNHGFTLGLRWIAADPAGSLRRTGKKIAIGLGALRLGYGASNRPAGISGDRRAVDFFCPDRSWLLVPHLLLMGAGGFLLVRRKGPRTALLVHLPLATHALALVLFFGYVRLLIVAMPVLLVDAALTMVTGWEMFIARYRAGHAGKRMRGTLIAALLLAAAVLEGGILAAREVPMRYHGKTELGGTRVNLDGRLRIWPESPDSLRIAPNEIR